MATERVNDSGIEIKPVYGPADLGRMGPREASSVKPGTYPYTLWHLPVDVPRPALDDSAVLRVRYRPGHQPAVEATVRRASPHRERVWIGR